MTPDRIAEQALIDMARLESRAWRNPMLDRADMLERLLCGFLTIEERRQYSAELLALTYLPEHERQAA